MYRCESIEVDREKRIGPLRIEFPGAGHEWGHARLDLGADQEDRPQLSFSTGSVPPFADTAIFPNQESIAPNQ